MNIEGAPQPEQSRFKIGDKVKIPESYVTRGLEGYIDQKAEGWVIDKIIMEPSPGHDSRPYAIVIEDNGKWTAGAKHISLEELEKANP